jgi:hypothetical protein
MDTFVRFGEKIGDFAGQVIDYVSTAIGGLYEGIMTNWDGFKKTFEDIFGDWKEMWKLATDNTSGLKEQFTDVGIILKGAVTAIAEVVHAMGDEIVTMNDILQLRHEGYTQTKAAGGQVEEAAKAPGVSDQDFETKIRKFQMQAMTSGAEDKEQVDHDIAEARKIRAGFKEAGQQDVEDVAGGRWDAINESIRVNSQKHQEGLNDYLATLLVNSPKAKEALLNGSFRISEGMDDFIKIIADKSPEIAAKLRMAGGKIAGKGGIKAPAAINFPNATFHIKQDFKDQDPDRILLTFRKDLSSAASSRLTSRMGLPGGM